MKRTAYILLGLLCFVGPGAAQQKDKSGCQDHPLFTRMPGYWISNCVHRGFDAKVFNIARNKTSQVEGEYWQLTYYPQAGATTVAGTVQIMRNFENAVKKLGGVSVYDEKIKQSFRIEKDRKEVWVEVWAEHTGKYGLTIVEKKEMEQDIVANAEGFANDLKATGHSAVYGILFDTGKSVVKPESDQALKEVAKLLKNDPALKVHVVGHTDNVGSVEANLKLSQERSDAVVKALVGSHGVAAARLKGFGAGPFAPVASNANEEGRAKNRRVELVQQ